MLELKQFHCKIRSVTPRKEYHGEGLVSSGSMKLELNAKSDILEMISEGLSECFFCGSKVPDLVDSAEGNDGFFTELRIPTMKFPVKVGMMDIYYTVIIHYGIDDGDIELKECKIPEASIKCLDGGGVSVDLKVNFHPVGVQASFLWESLQEEYLVTIIPECSQSANPAALTIIPECSQSNPSAEFVADFIDAVSEGDDVD